jgi:hypothetical protein
MEENRAIAIKMETFAYTVHTYSRKSTNNTPGEFQKTVANTLPAGGVA